MNPLFKDPSHEELCCLILRSFVEEFGAENVIVTVPAHWKDEAKSPNLGKVSLVFGSENDIIFAVVISGETKLFRSIQLADKKVE